jgi:manganese transport protein
VPIGVVGIATYAEMCGRVATITKRPVFDVVRQRLGFGPGLITLIASEAINILTVAAEVGGIALILQLYFADIPFRVLLLIVAVAIILLVWVLPFEGIERIFDYGGLCLTVYIVAAVHLHPDWSDVAGGFVPIGRRARTPSSTGTSRSASSRRRWFPTRSTSIHLVLWRKVGRRAKAISP